MYKFQKGDSVFVYYCPLIATVMGVGILQYVACLWRFPDVLHCHAVEADCLDVLIIFSMGI